MLMGLLTMAFAVGQTGCLERLAANSTAKIMNRASPAIQTFADPAIAEASLPYSITQMEGLMRVIPDNVLLRTNAMRAYGSYGYGFLEDRMEQAEVDDDEARIELYRQRATMAYLRAKEIGFETMTMDEDDDGGAMGAYRRSLDAWKAYVRRFDDAEQVGLVFWTAYAWARNINLNKENPDVLADLPYAIALFEQAYRLDHTYNLHAPHAAMGGYYARAAASLGGQPDDARREFETAINATQRHFLTYLVMEAKFYAVMVQDRALFRRLLEEVINAGDVMPEQRLANQIAKRRARRYLDRIDDLFGPEEPAGTEGATGSEGASGTTESSGTTAAPAATTPTP